jgi:hypothetical protein
MFRGFNEILKDVDELIDKVELMSKKLEELNKSVSMLREANGIRDITSDLSVLMSYDGRSRDNE